MSLQKKEIAALKAAMDTAQSSSEWYQYAQELDRLEGKYAWREDSQSTKFDADLLRREMATMQSLRANRKAFELSELLHESMHRNLGDFNSSGLYREAWSGTKLIIGEYLNELAYSIRFILDNDFDNITDAQKMHYLQQSDKNFGRSALVLSGGSTLGVFHIGVIKVLWEEKLLPRIISGSSMGSFVAGIVGTHTDAELDAFFGQSMGSRNTKFFRWNGITELVVTKALLDPDALATLIASQVKDYTFAEAYQLTAPKATRSELPDSSRLVNTSKYPRVVFDSGTFSACRA
jgi:NTE family protein